LFPGPRRSFRSSRAEGDRAGRFEAANGGDLLLDKVLAGVDAPRSSDGSQRT